MAIAFVYQLFELKTEGFKTNDAFHFDVVGIELIRLLAVVSGIFMLRGRNWARWLALAWIGFHVVLSFFHSLSQTAVHAVFFAVIAWCLFHAAAERYFRVRGPDRPAPQAG